MAQSKSLKELKELTAQQKTAKRPRTPTQSEKVIDAVSQKVEEGGSLSESEELEVLDAVLSGLKI